MTILRNSAKLLILILIAQPLGILGQSNSAYGNWQGVRGLANGTKISVETKDGRKVSGTLQSASDTTVTIVDNGRNVDIGRSEIRRLHRKSSSIAKSTAIGAAIGAGAGAGGAGALLGATGGSDSTNAIFAIGIAIGAGIGAGIGALLGSNKKKLVYEAS